MTNLEMTNAELVEVRNQQVVTDSRKVAEVFGKRHDNVMRDIENIIVGLLKIEDTHPTEMFFLESYINEQNGQKYLQYYMNRDGLSLLAMGFTGKKAMQWKLKYIEAFNQMEQQQKTQLTTADLFLQNAKLMKEHELQLAKLTKENKELKQETQLIKDTQKKQQSELDTLNCVCTDGTKRQKLNGLVRSYANKNGVQYADAWNLFKEMYNNAYHTNLKLQKTNYCKRNHIKKMSIPIFLEKTNQLDDALRVAEKM